ncbi:hypothetical protein PMZ80_006720 [Knufia obscura]|uniref:Uncharacterized protein n=1 Tax=Knufia obscura TaxID=1635080 RepID=A0ABR0RLF8_9EURO|nr:hypothetical protein PMZ80_006720 [Knufia obscura]
MDNLIHIVGEELNNWEEQTADSKRFSVFTQHVMLAEKISKRQHLTPRTSMQGKADRKASQCAKTSLPSSNLEAKTTPSKGPSSKIAPVNIGGPSHEGHKTEETCRPSQSASGEWTWRPSIPRRTSSMSTRRRTGNGARRPDLATFHRRSCQLFSSLDSTLSNATATASNGSRTSTSTSPSLTSSVTTQATSILDDYEYNTVAFPSLHLELHDPRVLTSRRQSRSVTSPQLGPRRSSSQLSPEITSTEQIFWTSEAKRQADYAKIDAAHGGFKGFVKKCLPRRWAWAHGKRRNFHQSLVPGPERTNDSDADEDSVRRFRISIASATQEAIRSVELHGVSRANTPVPFSSEVMAGEPRLDLETGYVGKKTKKDGSVTKVLSKVRSPQGLASMFRSRPSKA